MTATEVTNDQRLEVLNWLVDDVQSRLEKGERLIHDRQAEGLDTEKMQERWVKYLHAYEYLCDRRKDLGYPGEMSYVSTITS